MKNNHKKTLFYGFIIINILALLYVTQYREIINVADIKTFLTDQHFLVAYLIYIGILTVRGLTLLPGTPFLLVGIYLFSMAEVFFAIQIAIVSYCFIIYNFSHRLTFKIPEKILSFEQKIKSKEIPIIFALCFIPGVSINILIYFLSLIKVKLKSILIGIIAGTSITSLIYISLIKTALYTTGAT